MIYYLSLGSNLGAREQTLREALKRIGQQVGTVLRCSSFFYSEPWGFDSPNAFCNLCCAVETTLPPMEVLLATQAIECSLGRTEKSTNGQYHDRPIDIDLIRAFDDCGKEIYVQMANDQMVNDRMVNDQMVNDRMVNSLFLPHPLWQQRDFVRIPLAEIVQ